KSYDTLIDLPEWVPGALVADKAYDSDAIRDDLKQRGIRAVIPPKSNRTQMIRYNKRLYRQRNCIERVLGHLKINRAVATRYDQPADSYCEMPTLRRPEAIWLGSAVHQPRADAQTTDARAHGGGVVASPDADPRMRCVTRHSRADWGFGRAPTKRCEG